jgi:hypothetical protein
MIGCGDVALQHPIILPVQINTAQESSPTVSLSTKEMPIAYPRSTPLLA